MASENTSPKLISSEEYAKIDFTPDNLRRIMSSDPEAAIQIILTAHSAIHNLNSELKSAREHADGLEAAWQEDTQLKDQYRTSTTRAVWNVLNSVSSLLLQANDKLWSPSPSRAFPRKC